MNAEFSRVYKAYYGCFVKKISGKLRSTEDAKDLAQEVFMLFFNKLQSGAVIPDTLGWLNLACIYCLHNYQRTVWYRNVELGVVPEWFEEYLERLRLGGDAFWVWDEILQHMAALNREAFILVGLCHCPYPFAASELGITEYQITISYKNACREMVHELKKKGVRAPQELL